MIMNNRVGVKLPVTGTGSEDAVAVALGVAVAFGVALGVVDPDGVASKDGRSLA